MKWHSSLYYLAKMISGNLLLFIASVLIFLSSLFIKFSHIIRIPESLPSLHDQVLAAAADAAFSFSINHKKKQVRK